MIKDMISRSKPSLSLLIFLMFFLFSPLSFSEEESEEPPKANEFSLAEGERFQSLMEKLSKETRSVSKEEIIKHIYEPQELSHGDPPYRGIDENDLCSRDYLPSYVRYVKDVRTSVIGELRRYLRSSIEVLFRVFGYISQFRNSSSDMVFGFNDQGISDMVDIFHKMQNARESLDRNLQVLINIYAEFYQLFDEDCEKDVTIEDLESGGFVQETKIFLSDFSREIRLTERALTSQGTLLQNAILRLFISYEGFQDLENVFIDNFNDIFEYQADSLILDNKEY